MNFNLCQISNTVLNPSTGSDQERAINAIWENKKDDGYWKNRSYWEIPMWMAELSHTIPHQHHVATYIIENIPRAVFHEHNIYCFSVLDVTKDLVLGFVQSNPDVLFYLGGYVDPAIFDKYENVEWFDTVKEFAHGCGFDYRQGTDYRLFEGERTIPRLTLSTGCSNKCRFCTSEDTVVERSEENIMQQLLSFRPLDFELVYISDKTFGQAVRQNMKVIAILMRGYNQNFKGFIVQTTCAQVLKDPDLFDQDEIEVVELGVETYNNPILQEMRKPQSEAMIDMAVNYLHSIGKKIIVNLVLGMPNETDDTYGKTLEWLSNNREKFYALAVYTLAVYETSELAGIIQSIAEDRNENKAGRSFWSPKEMRAYTFWAPHLYELGVQIAAQGGKDS